MNRRRPRNTKVAPGDDVAFHLRQEYPARVRTAIALTARGQITGPRRCLVCGKAGKRAKVFVSDTALRVGATPEQIRDGCLCYWACEACAGLPTP